MSKTRAELWAQLHMDHLPAVEQHWEHVSERSHATVLLWSPVREGGPTYTWAWACLCVRLGFLNREWSVNIICPTWIETKPKTDCRQEEMDSTDPGVARSTWASWWTIRQIWVIDEHWLAPRINVNKITWAHTSLKKLSLPEWILRQDYYSTLIQNGWGDFTQSRRVQWSILQTRRGFNLHYRSSISSYNIFFYKEHLLA